MIIISGLWLSQTCRAPLEVWCSSSTAPTTTTLLPWSFPFTLARAQRKQARGPLASTAPLLPHRNPPLDGVHVAEEEHLLPTVAGLYHGVPCIVDMGGEPVLQSEP